jgi:ribose transport system substrate-binding protein
MSASITPIRRLSLGVAVMAVALLGAACDSAATSGSGAEALDHNYAGPGPDSPEAAAAITAAGIVDNTDWCGDKQITVGVEDGFGNNDWSRSSFATVRSELAKCSNVKQVVLSGGGDLPKAISDVNSLVSQGVDAIVLIPDFGEAQLPSIKAATAAGVKVVNWAADPGGEPGKDYVAYVDEIQAESGKTWANWVSKQLGGKGNIVYLGGPAGNPVSTGYLAGIASVVADNPGLKLLTGTKDWPVTNWDPAQAQKVMSTLIAKYPQIDAVIADESGSGAAALRALNAAGRNLPLVATIESNELGCLYDDISNSGKDVGMATTSARNWMGRVAARKAVAAAEGLPEDSPSRYALPLYEDSTGSLAPQCDKAVSPTMYFSNQLTAADLEKWGSVS